MGDERCVTDENDGADGENGDGEGGDGKAEGERSTDGENGDTDDESESEGSEWIEDY